LRIEELRNMGNAANGKQALHNRLSISPSFVIFMTMFIDMIGYGMVIPVLPFHPETAGSGALSLGLLVGSFSLMQFVFSPVLGWLSDKTGRRPVILFSIFTSALSFLLFAVADSFIVLLLSRIAAGMATEAAVAQAYISDITTEKDRAKGMGRVGAANGAGFIIGPALGGLLSMYGLSALGYAAAVLTGVNFFFAFFFLPESNGRTAQNQQKASDGYWRRLAQALTSPLIGVVLVILFLTVFAFSTMPVIVPLLGISYFGFTELEMSYFFMYIGVVQIVLQGVLIGKLAKRHGEENLTVLASLLIALGMFIMPLFPNIVAFFAALTMTSSGFGILNTVLPSYLSKRTAADEQGGMMGVAQSVGSIARIPGPLVAGFVADLAGLHAAFLLGSAIVLVAFILGLKVFRTPTQDHRRVGAVKVVVE